MIDEWCLGFKDTMWRTLQGDSTKEDADVQEQQVVDVLSVSEEVISIEACLATWN